jgi:hypothetical protein
MTTNGTRHGILATLWTVYAVLMVAIALWIFVCNRTLTLMWGAIINHVANPLMWMTLFHFFLIATVLMALLSAIFSFLAAYAFLQGAASAHKWGLAAAAFGMLGPPPGVALGVFTAITLFPLRSEERIR